VTIPETPPKWLAWAGTPTMRAATTLVAMFALLVSAVLYWQLQQFTQCVADQQRADAARTVVISKATDAERRADAALVAGPQPGGPDARALRAADVAARQYTDSVRAANPPLPLDPC
jgi:hypothetical protein